MGLNRRIFSLFAAGALALLALSCKREPVGTAVQDDEIRSQRVLFSSGNVENVISKAPATPYMAQNGRFVCTMYYKSGVDPREESDFDIDGGTSELSWLSVNNTYGNSVYRMSDFRPITKTDEEAYIVYGFDPDADFFYWKNRLSHVFVAYADYNNLDANQWHDGWDPSQHPRALFMYPMSNGSKTTYEDNWVSSYFLELDSDLNIVKRTDTQHSGFNVKTITDSEWYKEYKEQLTPETDAELLRTTHVEFLDADGSTYKKLLWHVENDNDPEHRCVYCRVQKKDRRAITSPANVLDLRRAEGMTKMEDQPDPILAVNKKKPEGSEQETNRVHLYFKHQFSLIQVNLKIDAEGSAYDIDRENGISVELLGVSETGYVFTHITKEGNGIPADYLPVDISKYSAAHLADNPYGTSFAMFPMPAEQTPSNALKSFNAIAFGMLEAIRITWKEAGDGGIVHTATMKVDKDEHGDDLKKLESGVKYIYDIELQRSSISLIRTHLVDWKLDDAHQVVGNGTVSQ